MEGTLALKRPHVAPLKERNQQNASPNVRSSRLPPFEAFQDRYEMGELLGHGGFGYVRSCYRKSDGKTLAVKVILRNKNRSWSEDVEWGCVPREVHVLKHMSHRNVIKLMDVYESKDCIFMVTEKPNCTIDLFEYIEKNVGMGEKKAHRIFTQVIEGVAYLHRNGITHRDIKDENILLDEETLETKLIDFGSATAIKKDVYQQFRGTREYAAPEVLLAGRYHAVPSEVWSLGVLLFTLVYATNPFETEADTIRGELRPPYRVSPELHDLMAQLLQAQPSKRPTVEQILRHPWICGKILKRTESSMRERKAKTP